MEEWSAVASQAGCVALLVKKERIEERITGHADAIVHLNLPCKVVEPVSLWQVQKEAAAREVLNWVAPGSQPLPRTSK